MTCDWGRDRGTGSEADAMAAVTFDKVSKVYPDGTRAVNHLDLGIKDGEFMVLVGPSGCGKTTALRMLAGLEDISEGRVVIGERVVNHVPSRDRDIAMVFQSYALYPHLSVYENIAFGLRVKKVPKDEIDRRVRDAARILDLEGLLDRKPRNLSGGQRQRVAMGRAIVRHPQAFLMDEPLSNLDAKLRVQTRAEIAKLQHDLGVTTLYVTHDQVEALTMGDRVAVMRKGELQQVDDPQVLYDRPVNLFVAGFIGSPAMNMLEARLESADGRSVVRLGSQTLTLDDEAVATHPALRAYEGRPIILGIRPEDLDDATLKPESLPDRRLKGKVELTEALGSEVMVHFSIDAAHAVTEDVHELQADIGADRAPGSGVASEATGAVVVGRFGPRSRVHVGDTVEVAVDTRSLHFFDPETSLGIYDNPPAKEPT
jgi:multiple sugar transport system ATP-binding protein